MKITIAILALALSATSAAALEISSCEEAGVILNSVTDMRTYANSSVKVFSVDRIEPAAAPIGVAVTIDRGDDLSTMESYCRYVSGLSDVNLKAAKASYNKTTGNLTLTMPAEVSDGNGNTSKKYLLLVINKAANEDKLVSATLK